MVDQDWLVRERLSLGISRSCQKTRRRFIKTLFYMLYVQPGHTPVRIAAMVHDVDRHVLHMRFRDSWAGIAEDDLDVLEALAEDLTAKGEEWGADKLVDWMLDTLSHVLQVTDPIPIATEDPEGLLKDFHELNEWTIVPPQASTNAGGDEE